MRSSNRPLLVGLLVVVALLVLAACAPVSVPPSATSAPAASTSAPQATLAPTQPTTAPAASAEQKVIVVGSGQDIGNLDPHTGSDYATRALQRNLYDALVRYDGNPPKIVPQLAESWDISSDGLEYTFHLVKNAKFHDGSPLTAEAVKYSFDRMVRLNKGIAWMFTAVIDQNSTTVVDANTVKIKLNKAFAPFLSVVPWLWVVNPAVVKANQGSDDGQTYLKDHEAGSGAFTIKRWEPGNLYELARWDGYWRTAGRGNLTGAIWKIVREASSQRLSVQKGDIHIAVDLSGDDMDALKGAPGVVLIEQPEFRTFSIKFNYANGATADVNLRKAISYAFDYQAMLDAEGPGHASLMVGPLPANILGADPNLSVPKTDLAKAKEYLAKSKYPNGGVKLSYVYVSGLEIERKFGLILLDSLKKLGIDLDVKQMVWTDMVALTKDAKTTPDFFPDYQTANYADPDNVLFAAYHGSQVGNWTNPTYANPKVDELILQARGMRNDADRVKAYAQIQSMIVDDAPDIFGVLEKRKLAMSDKIQGWSFVPIASNAIDYYPLSLK